MSDPTPDSKAHEAGHPLSAAAAARTLAEETAARHGALCWPGTAHIEEVIREAEERGAARERKRCLDDIGGRMRVGTDNSALRDVIEAIYVRAAADALEDEG